MATIAEMHEAVRRSALVADQARKAIETIGGVASAVDREAVTAAIDGIHRQHAEWARSTVQLDGLGDSLVSNRTVQISDEVLALASIAKIVTSTQDLFQKVHDRLVEAGIESPDLHTQQFELIYGAVQAHKEQNPEFVEDEILRYWVTYDIVIVIETKIRSVITKALEAAYGTAWWEHLPRKVKDNCSHFKAKREIGEDIEHPIEAYLSLSDMVKVFQHSTLWSSVFRPLFPVPIKLEWSLRWNHYCQFATIRPT